MTLSEKQAKQQIKDLKAKLKIATHALNTIEKIEGLDGGTFSAAQVVKRARFNIKFYGTFKSMTQRRINDRNKTIRSNRHRI